MNYFQLSLRNILRHRNRSLVTITTVCLGFIALGVIGGVLTNIFSRLKGQAIVIEKLGHITFAKEGFHENGKLNPEKYLWDKPQVAGILQTLRADPDVVIATPRIKMYGIASNGKASTIFITEAIVPDDDQQLIKTPIDGRIEDAGTVSLSSEKARFSEVAIGSELASMLGVKKGEHLTLLATTKDGQANAVDVDVATVYNTGNPGTNDKFVLTDFTLAQQLYDTEGAERIIVTVKQPEKVLEVKERLLSKLKSAGYLVEAKGWEEQSLTYNKVKMMFGAIFRVLTIIITVIVLLTLLNTMQMAITERTREIGTMRAIGMLRRDVIKIFSIEGVMMGIIGCMVAVPILFLISNLLQVANITFIPPVASSAVPLVLKLDPQKLVFVFVVFTIAALISSFLVARKISRQKVVDSLMQFN